MVLPSPHRKDHAEQLGDGGGVSLAPGTALANAEAAAGAQHGGRPAGVQVLARRLGHGAAEPRGEDSPFPPGTMQSPSPDTCCALLANPGEQQTLYCREGLQ